MVPTHLIISH